MVEYYSRALGTIIRTYTGIQTAFNLVILLAYIPVSKVSFVLYCHGPILFFFFT